MYLDKINGPDDVKMLSTPELVVLAAEMRDVLLKKLSLCGGHFGSNFGMVETTIALHYVFESPRDKIIFDVSHQSHCHKILTGRKDAFLIPENYNDVTGYSCPDESAHDHFKIGHTATSISLACGMAKARDLAGEKNNVIAIIGDGAMGGGEALEGLNYAWELHSNLIIILNDNAMSIAENHGGLYEHLRKLRESDGRSECNVFKALGIDYRFVKDGHDINSLIDAFKEVKDIDHPVIIHVCTTKGKGYEPAEADKENWHWCHPFDIETGKPKRNYAGETYDTVGRDFLTEKMRNDPSVAVLVAAVPLSIRYTADRRKAAGNQFIDVGIAEEHAIAMAAGMAKAGGKPVFVTDCTFFQRTYDQIAQEVCLNRCPVTLLVRNASVYGMRDATHLGIFDIPLLSNIPNLVYLAPINKQEYISMLEWSIEQNENPVAIRIPKGDIIETAEEIDCDYSDLNRFKVCTRGSKIAILALGDFFQIGQSVAEKLNCAFGITSTLINPRFISGIDDMLLREIEKDHDIVVTIEDGILSGGFGEKITRFYGTTNIKVLTYGLEKEFIDRYDVAKILQINRLTPDQIIDDIMSIL